MNQEYIILPIARDTKAILLFSERPTQEAIEKLIQFLELEKDTYPTKDELETVADEKAG